MNDLRDYFASIASKLSVPNPLETEEQQRHLFECCDSNDEAFARLDYCGIAEITWSDALDMAYAEWQYFNNK